MQCELPKHCCIRAAGLAPRRRRRRTVSRRGAPRPAQHAPDRRRGARVREAGPERKALHRVGQGNDKKDLIHVWGSPYENGYAMGELLGSKLVTCVNSVYQ
eukprot:2799199-Prymnesium_polylepis.1